MLVADDAHRAGCITSWPDLVRVARATPRPRLHSVASRRPPCQGAGDAAPCARPGQRRGWSRAVAAGTSRRGSVPRAARAVVPGGPRPPTSGSWGCHGRAPRVPRELRRGRVATRPRAGICLRVPPGAAPRAIWAGSPRARPYRGRPPRLRRRGRRLGATRRGRARLPPRGRARAAVAGPPRPPGAAMAGSAPVDRVLAAGGATPPWPGEVACTPRSVEAARPPGVTAPLGGPHLRVAGTRACAPPLAGRRQGHQGRRLLWERKP